MNLENAAIGAALGSIIAMLGYMTVKTMLDNSMGGLVPDINFSAYLPPSGSAQPLLLTDKVPTLDLGMTIEDGNKLLQLVNSGEPAFFSLTPAGLALLQQLLKDQEALAQAVKQGAEKLPIHASDAEAKALSIATPTDLLAFVRKLMATGVLRLDVENSRLIVNTPLFREILENMPITNRVKELPDEDEQNPELGSPDKPLLLKDKPEEETADKSEEKPGPTEENPGSAPSASDSEAESDFEEVVIVPGELLVPAVEPIVVGETIEAAKLGSGAATNTVSVAVLAGLALLMI